MRLQDIDDSLHVFNTLNTLLPRTYFRPVQLPLHKVFIVLLRALHHPTGQRAPTVFLDHSQMLDILVGGEVQFPSIKLCDDAPDRPNVTDSTPLATS